MIHFRSPPPTTSQVPFKRTPSPCSPRGPVRRHPSTEHSTFYPLKIHLSLRVPGKGATSMFPNMVPVDRDSPSPDPLVYSFIHVRLPESAKRSPPTYGGKHKVTVHGTPRRRKACIQLGAAWFPNGIVDDIAIYTPVPCSPRHDTVHLGLGRPQPH